VDEWIELAHLNTGFGVARVDAGRTGRIRASSGIFPSRE
jgi:hypothetical protein